MGNGAVKEVQIVTVNPVDTTAESSRRNSVENATDEYRKKWRDDRYEKWDVEAVTELRSTMIKCLKGLQQVDKIECIVCGGTGEGKSSLINNFMTAFRNKYSPISQIGTGKKQITTQYIEFQTFEIEDKGVKKFSLIFADTRGFSESKLKGAPVAAIKACIMGNVKSGETIDPKIAEQQWGQKKQKKPRKASYIFFVADCTRISNNDASDEQIKNLLKIREFSKTENIPVAGFLTKCDLLDPKVKDDPSNLYYSEQVECQVIMFSEMFDIAVNRVFPVVNYTSQLDPSNEMMMQTLLALNACIGDIEGAIGCRVDIQ